MYNGSSSRWEISNSHKNSGKLALIRNPAGNYFYMRAAFENHALALPGASNYTAMKYGDSFSLREGSQIVLFLEKVYTYVPSTQYGRKYGDSYYEVIWEDKIGYISERAKMEIIHE